MIIFFQQRSFFKLNNLHQALNWNFDQISNRTNSFLPARLIPQSQRHSGSLSSPYFPNDYHSKLRVRARQTATSPRSRIPIPFDRSYFRLTNFTAHPGRRTSTGKCQRKMQHNKNNTKPKIKELVKPIVFFLLSSSSPFYIFSARFPEPFSISLYYLYIGVVGYLVVLLHTRR